MDFVFCPVQTLKKKKMHKANDRHSWNFWWHAFTIFLCGGKLCCLPSRHSIMNFFFSQGVFFFKCGVGLRLHFNSGWLKAHLMSPWGKLYFVQGSRVKKGGGEMDDSGWLDCLLGVVQQHDYIEKVQDNRCGKQWDWTGGRRTRRREKNGPWSLWRSPGCCQGRSDREMCWDEWFSRACVCLGKVGCVVWVRGGHFSRIGLYIGSKGSTPQLLRKREINLFFYRGKKQKVLQACWSGGIFFSLPLTLLQSFTMGDAPTTPKSLYLAP